MMEKIIRSMIAMVAIAFTFNSSSIAKEPRIATHLGVDSTILTLKVNPYAKLKAGKTFQATIHVGIKKGWSIHSSMMPDGGNCTCASPLEISLPDSLSNFYELVRVKELGTIRNYFDSD